MKTLLSISLFSLSLLFFMGCEEDTVEVHQDDQLTGELTLSSDHVHTLSEITYTAKITDSNGDAVTDLEEVEVQRKAHGSEEWSGTELTLDGEVYKGNYTFYSSGEYDLRLAAMLPDESEMKVIHEMEDHFEVGRAHEEVNGYRIEYEHFPGHMHDGDEANVKFWVKEAEEDASGDRPAVSGLNPTIICTNPDGSTEEHQTVEEPESGVYQVHHQFMGNGEAQEKMEFTGTDDSTISATFEFHVSEGH